MSKHNKPLAKAGTAKVNKSETELGRGKITNNFLAALVTSKVYKMQVVKAKKGKGSYQRKAKNVRGESYLMAA
ncbi:MAG TPA: ribosome alternative rescue factor ArfA [Colwellia sp.]|nr:ribosome alternative rescue factor ArfA [Colwellia sp.]|tara:strand:+ start:4366 stop:4584 length:219 start_codon:yes stop_codon:yes gene_type:complete